MNHHEKQRVNDLILFINRCRAAGMARHTEWARNELAELLYRIALRREGRAA